LQENRKLRAARGDGLGDYARYPLLGLNLPFTAKQVTAIYRKLAKVYHADAGGADRQMQLLNAKRDRALIEATEVAANVNRGTSPMVAA